MSNWQPGLGQLDLIADLLPFPRPNADTRTPHAHYQRAQYHFSQPQQARHLALPAPVHCVPPPASPGQPSGSLQASGLGPDASSGDGGAGSNCSNSTMLPTLSTSLPLAPSHPSFLLTGGSQLRDPGPCAPTPTTIYGYTHLATRNISTNNLPSSSTQVPPPVRPINIAQLSPAAFAAVPCLCYPAPLIRAAPALVQHAARQLSSSSRSFNVAPFDLHNLQPPSPAQRDSDEYETPPQAQALQLPPLWSIVDDLPPAAAPLNPVSDSSVTEISGLARLARLLDAFEDEDLHEGEQDYNANRAIPDEIIFANEHVANEQVSQEGNLWTEGNVDIPAWSSPDENREDREDENAQFRHRITAVHTFHDPTMPPAVTGGSRKRSCPSASIDDVASSSRQKRRRSQSILSTSSHAVTKVRKSPCKTSFKLPDSDDLFVIDDEDEDVDMVCMTADDSIPDELQGPPEERPSTKLCKFECIICLDTVSTLTVTHCGHMFCGACLHQAMHAEVTKKICPMCRQKLEDRPTHVQPKKSAKTYFHLEIKLELTKSQGKQPVRHGLRK